MDVTPPLEPSLASFPHVLLGSIPPLSPSVPNPILESAGWLQSLCPTSPIRALAPLAPFGATLKPSFGEEQSS